MERVILPYKEVKKYINTGDVALFRGQGLISSIISSQTDTTYSHVGVLSWSNGDANTDDGMLELTEYREGFGSRTINFENEIKRLGPIIDIYRPTPYFSSLHFDPETKDITLIRKEFDGKAVTRMARKMTGLPYGWKRIWWMIKNKLVFFRFMSKESLMSDKIRDVVYPVCSTATAYWFNYNGFDLLNNKADEWMEPGHIAMSPRLNYLFTPIWD